MNRRPWAVAADRRDEGSVLLLTIGLVVVLVALLVVVAGVSQVFLARRALVAATDAAALRAAQAADLDALYVDPDGSRPGAALPLDRRAAAEAVADYADRAGLDERFDAFEVVSVTVDSDSVTVRTRAQVRLALVGPVTSGRSSVTVEASSTARLRVR